MPGVTVHIASVCLAEACGEPAQTVSFPDASPWFTGEQFIHSSKGHPPCR